MPPDPVLAGGRSAPTGTASSDPNGDPLPGTYYVRLSSTELPEKDLGLPVAPRGAAAPAEMPGTGSSKFSAYVTEINDLRQAREVIAGLLPDRDDLHFVGARVLLLEVRAVRRLARVGVERAAETAVRGDDENTPGAADCSPRRHCPARSGVNFSFSPCRYRRKIEQTGS